MNLPTPGIVNLKSGFDAGKFVDLHAARLINIRMPLSDAEFRVIGVRLREWPSLHVRVYGAHVGDLSFLRYLATLTSLSIELGSLSSFAGLEYVGPQLRSLALGPTLRKLAVPQLASFSQLTGLAIWGHTRNIESIEDLTLLTSLALRSVRHDWLRQSSIVARLRSLTIEFGSSSDLDYLHGATQLRSLTLSHIRRLSNVAVLGTMVMLEALELDNQRDIIELPSFANLMRLHWLRIHRMARIDDLAPIAAAPALIDLHVTDMPHLRVQDFAPLLSHRSLRGVTVGLGSRLRDEEAAALLRLPRASHQPVFESDDGAR